MTFRTFGNDVRRSYNETRNQSKNIHKKEALNGDGTHIVTYLRNLTFSYD